MTRALYLLLLFFFALSCVDVAMVPPRPVRPDNSALYPTSAPLVLLRGDVAPYNGMLYTPEDNALVGAAASQRTDELDAAYTVGRDEGQLALNYANSQRRLLLRGVFYGAPTVALLFFLLGLSVAR